MQEHTKNYDVAVIGGGAAGLNAAQALGRSRRSVVVIDAGQPRNAPAAGVHNFLSRDGFSPLELLEVGRAELVQYGVDVINTRALDTHRTETGFTVELANGARVGARRIILASGLKDELLQIPGLAEHWGKDVLHCPYCHGWEVKDLRLGVVDSTFAMHQAPMFTQWSKRVTLFKDLDRVFSFDEAELLEALGIEVVDAQVTRVQEMDGSITGVELSDGTTRDLDALVIMPKFDVDVSCVRSLGLQTQDHFSGIGKHVAIDDEGQTEVPGLWAAGNVTNPMAQVIMAAAEGMGVGARVNADLMQEEYDLAVEQLRTKKVEQLRVKKAALNLP